MSLREVYDDITMSEVNKTLMKLEVDGVLHVYGLTKSKRRVELARVQVRLVLRLLVITTRKFLRFVRLDKYLAFSCTKTFPLQLVCSALPRRNQTILEDLNLGMTLQVLIHR